VFFLYPINDYLPEQRCKIEHPLRISLRNGTGTIVIADVSLFTEIIQLGN